MFHRLKYCVHDAASKGGKALDAASEELIDLMYKNAR